MIDFYLYDSQGRITSCGVCPDEDIALQAQPGLSVGVGRVDVSALCFVDGGRLMTAPPRPTSHHQFDYTLKQWVFDNAGAWASARAERNRLLAASDWTQLPDVPLATKQAWATYRQALRDLTQQSDPLNIVWPTAPG